MNQENLARMQCMEVWGGNQAVQRSVETAGLKIWVYSRPCGEARSGGDVHYVSSCASGRVTRMLLADVSGHGENASQVAIALRDLMRRNVNYIKQARFVQAMNQQFTKFGEQGLFATALASTFFAPTRSFVLCNAGHPAPLLYRRDNSSWSPFHRNRHNSKNFADTPFGVREEATYGQSSIKLNEGDMVLSFSDAVTESEDASGRQLGAAGILRVARELQWTQPDFVIPAVVDRLRNMASGNLKQDDVTLVLVQATGGGTTLKNNLLSPFRMLGPVADKTRLSYKNWQQSPN